MDILREAVRRIRARPAASGSESAPELDVRVLMEQVRGEVPARRAGLRQRPTPPAPAPQLVVEPASFPRQTALDEAIASRAEYTLGELLSFSDEAFVRSAYRALFRREPDLDGFWFNLNRLYLGLSKVDMLQELRQSEEGRKSNVRVRGLARAVRMRRLRNAPVLGAMLAIVQYLFALPMFVRSLERQEILVYRHRRETRAAMDVLAASAETFADASSRRTAAAIQAIGDSLGRLEREKASRAMGVILSERLASLGSEVAKVASAVAENASHQEMLRLAESTLEAASRLSAAIDSLDQAKADALDVDSRLAAARDALELKADAEEARRGIEEVKAEVKAGLERKADAEEARRGIEEVKAEVKAGLERKAEGATVARRFEQVGKQLHLKASAKKTLSAFEEVRAGLQRKADAEEARHGIEEVRVHLGLKAEAKDVAERFAEMFSRDRIEATLRSADHGLDDFYLSFEDRFRGSRDDIKNRVSVYIPVIKEVGAGTAEAPVADLGCGRGEWLEVLRDSALVGRGVDLNQAVLKVCRDRGLDVLEEDAIEHLRGLPAGSLGAITGMHIIEHIPFRRLIALFDEALRVLKPGGVAIFETPNPENLIVGACNFWYDPTHLHPMPPEATRFIAQSRGFSRVEVMRLHPFPPPHHLQDAGPDTSQKLNALLYGAQDYSVVAYKN